MTKNQYKRNRTKGLCGTCMQRFTLHETQRNCRTQSFVGCATLVLMPEIVNIEAKNLLAKLLASENIWIQHRKVETASFDMQNRVLTFPMWKEMSDCVYTLLAGHETSHALNSYDTVKEGSRTIRVNASKIAYATRIDPKNLELAGSYWNIIEDARIERLITVPYPGMKAIFADGYRELYKNDMFGIKGRDTVYLDALPFIDRINLQCKIGHLLNLTFSGEEDVLLRKVGNTVTMDDVVAVTKEIYEWCKQNELQPPPPITMKMTMEELEKFLEENPQDGQQSGRMTQKIYVEITDAPDEGDDEGDEGDDEGDEGDEGDESGDESGGDGKSGDEGKEDGKESGDGEENGDGKDGKGKGKKGKGSDKGEADGDASDGDGEADGENDKDGKEGSKGNSNKPGKKPTKPVKPGKTGKAGNGRELTVPVDPGPPMGPATQKFFDQQLQKLRDPNAVEIVYVTLPKPNLDKIIIPFEAVHQGIRKHFNARDMAQAEKDFATFRDAQMPVINYILQQFEMRKQADRYKRTKQHRTGALDTLQLAHYKTRDDLFKTIAICQDGKNHGLIFVVDWSGSMQGQMAGTLEQLMILCMFCRKAQIPFEVYSLTTGGTNAFSREPGNLAYAQNFRMRTYLSSRMIPAVFTAACENLFALMPEGRYSGGPTADNLIGCTPLDESIVTTIDLVKEFKRKTHAQVVNTIFLTDGGANTVSQYYDMKGIAQNMYNYGGGYYYNYGRNSNSNSTKYLVDDRETHKTYAFTTGDMTPTMVKILRDRNNIHAVCFYIDGSYETFFTTEIDDAKRKQLDKQFSDNGFVVSTEWGFDEVYITKRADWRLKDIKLKPSKIEAGTPEYMKQVDKNFIAQGQNLMKQRLMLDRFVGMIA